MASEAVAESFSVMAVARGRHPEMHSDPSFDPSFDSRLPDLQHSAIRRHAPARSQFGWNDRSYFVTGIV